jgi:hypothetical protein
MIIQELETGLFLDLPLQQYIEKFTVSNIRDFLIIDENHAEDNLKIFSLLCYKNSPLKHKTIYNPPLEPLDGTDSGTGQPIMAMVPGTITYRVSFFENERRYFVRVKNTTDNKETYCIKRQDLEYWNGIVNKIKTDYYN